MAEVGVAGVDAMDDDIQGERPELRDKAIAAAKPTEQLVAHDQGNPFKVADKDMGPVRKRIIIVGFVGLLVLGYIMNQPGLHPLSDLASLTFLIGSVVYFVWLAQWTTWNRPIPAGEEIPFKLRESRMEWIRRAIVVVV